ncbi:MAG TPA: diguanylate cyclase [Tepidisphaeraceae bacterium]|jgi:diguanylate cyclase (GGDEF)-like protein|nr:diguanylate cyclase [Tepidisphaeraceae bacterium]
MNSVILIVDDSPELHKLIRVHLDGEPIDIYSSFIGEQAIVDAVKLRPNLILLDLDMPGMSGFDVCRRLKADNNTSAIPIIFLTADSSQGNQIKGLDLGANSFMSKGFKPEELRARIRAALRVKSEIEKLAMVDGLTGLWNRTYMDLHLASHLSHAHRTKRPLACAVVDLDNLKHINRNHGRKIGDEVVRTVGHILASQGRAEDTAGYLINGKFMLIFPGITCSGAGAVAERARAEIEKQLAEFEGLAVNATCSLGISDTQSGTDASLLDRANQALIRAKSAGRNRICGDDSQPLPEKTRAAA